MDRRRFSVGPITAATTSGVITTDQDGRTREMTLGDLLKLANSVGFDGGVIVRSLGILEVLPPHDLALALPALGEILGEHAGDLDEMPAFSELKSVALGLYIRTEAMIDMMASDLGKTWCPTGGETRGLLGTVLQVAAWAPLEIDAEACGAFGFVRDVLEDQVGALIARNARHLH